MFVPHLGKGDNKPLLLILEHSRKRLFAVICPKGTGRTNALRTKAFLLSALEAYFPQNDGETYVSRGGAEVFGSIPVC